MFKDVPLIFEIGLVHGGVLGQAIALCDVIRDAGGTVVKFQIHRSDWESSIHESFRVEISSQYSSRLDYWDKTGFSDEEWRELFDHCRSIGLFPFASVFAPEGLDLLSKLNCEVVKLASGEVYNEHLIRALLNGNFSVIASLGLATEDVVDSLSARLEDRNLDYSLMQCCSAYPSSIAGQNLSSIKVLNRKYGCPIGLSDHTGSVFTVPFAICHGAAFGEVHVVWDKRFFGPDSSASIQISDLPILIEGVKLAKESLSQQESIFQEPDVAMIQLFGHGLYASRDISPGEVVSAEMFKSLKPIKGVSSLRLSQLEGRLIRKAMREGDCLREQDIELAP